MGQIWMEQDHIFGDGCDEVVPPIHDASPVAALRLLVVAPPDMGDIDLAELAQDGAARILARTSLADAAGRLDQMVHVDAVWLFAATDMPDGPCEALAQALAARDCPLICEAPVHRIDALYGHFSGLRQAIFLSEAQAIDRKIALARVTATGRMCVRDVAGDAAADRLDQLQEEVARISRLLAQLSAPGPDLHPPLFPQLAGGADDYSTSVRSPTRSYSAEPGLASFERGLSVQRQRARQIRQMIRRRRMREQFFPAELFADPAWDMLLDLYAAQLEGQSVSVSSLCIAAAVPATTALRWIKTMTDAGIFERRADPRDGRRIFIAMEAKTEAALARYFEALEDIRG